MRNTNPRVDVLSDQWADKNVHVGSHKRLSTPSSTTRLAIYVLCDQFTIYHANVCSLILVMNGSISPDIIYKGNMHNNGVFYI